MSSNDFTPAYDANIPSEIRYDETLSVRAKLMYGEIRALSNKLGYCWATDKYFSELYGVSIDTVSRAVKQLRERGYIEVELASNGSGTERRIYIGLFIGRDRGIRKNADTPVNDKTEGGVRKNADRGVRRNAETGTRKNAYQNNINKNIYITPISPELLTMVKSYAGDDGRLLKALMDMVELRARLRKPYKTERQITLLLNELDKLAEGHADRKYALLDKAVEMGWLKVYPLKDGDMPGGGSYSSSVYESEEVEEWKPAKT